VRRSIRAGDTLGQNSQGVGYAGRLSGSGSFNVKADFLFTKICNLKRLVFDLFSLIQHDGRFLKVAQIVGQL